MHAVYLVQHLPNGGRGVLCVYGGGGAERAAPLAPLETRAGPIRPPLILPQVHVETGAEQTADDRVHDLDRGINWIEPSDADPAYPQLRLGSGPVYGPDPAGRDRIGIRQSRLSDGIAMPAGENGLQPLGQLFRARQVSDEYEGGRGGAIVAIVKLSQVGA